jgi:hypothetical protein
VLIDKKRTSSPGFTAPYLEPKISLGFPNSWNPNKLGEKRTSPPSSLLEISSQGSHWRFQTGESCTLKQEEYHQTMRKRRRQQFLSFLETKEKRHMFYYGLKLLFLLACFTPDA